MGFQPNKLPFYSTGADVFHAGISTHAVASQSATAIEEELLSSKMNTQVEISECLGKFTKEAVFLQEQFSLEPHLPIIDQCFSAPTVEGIFTELESADHPFAKEVLTSLKKMSPLALKITKRALEEGSEKTLAECLQMEYRLSQRFCADHDFPEGCT